MRIPEETIDRIRQSADILEVINDFVSLKKRGSNYIACCPFHNEKTPSFNVNPTRQIYKCFGCGKAGDAIRFVMDIENIGYGEALRYLAKKYGVEIEEQEQTPEDLLRQNERESLLIVLNFAKTFFQETLLNSDDGKSIGLSYFRERGFTTPTIDAFDLGYSLDQWDGLLQEGLRRGHSREMMEKAGLILIKENDKVFDRFRGRVMFPIHNVSGRVIAFGARILKADKSQPKYLNSPETAVYHKSQVLYGIFQAKQSIRQEDVCYLTEGYTDVISLHQAGIKNVVASSGTSLTTEQIRLIARFTPNITILYDGDVAGIKAGLRGLNIALEEGIEVKVVALPQSEDPDSYVKRIGATDFKKFIDENSRPFLSFLTKVLLEEAGEDPLKKAVVVDEIIRTLVLIPDPVKREFYTKVIAHDLKFNITEQSITSKANQLILQRRNEEIQNAKRQTQLKKITIDSNIYAEEGKESLEDINALLNGLDIDLPADSSVQTVTSVQPQYRQPAVRTALSYQEEECVRLLMNYGTRELEPGITLCHYILSELNDVDFQTVPYDFILTLYREAYGQGKILLADDFLNRPTDTDEQQYEAILHQAINMTTPRYEISEGWVKHEIFVPSEEEDDILAMAAYRNILRIKKTLAEQRMTSLQQQLRDLKGATPDEADQLMIEYMHVKRIDMQISQELGTVISG